MYVHCTDRISQWVSQTWIDCRIIQAAIVILTVRKELVIGTTPTLRSSSWHSFMCLYFVFFDQFCLDTYCIYVSFSFRSNKLLFSFRFKRSAESCIVIRSKLTAHDLPLSLCKFTSFTVIMSDLMLRGLERILRVKSVKSVVPRKRLISHDSNPRLQVLEIVVEY